MRWIVYNVLFAIGFGLRLPGFLLRMWRRGGYRRGFLQRLAIYDRDTRRRLAEPGRIWIHAVSVGEAFVAFGLMEAARRRQPGVRFLMTVNTSTAHHIALQRLANTPDLLLYFPVDFPPVVRRVLRLARPQALLLVEGEFWPNLIRIAADQGVFIGLVNGRLSPSSARGYRFLHAFMRPVIAQFRAACMQSDGDRARLLSIGAAPGRAHTVGSVKYDTVATDADAPREARAALRAAGVPEDAVLLLGGSTWPGEEALLLDLYAALKPTHPDLVLGLAPRHVERLASIEKDIAARRLRAVRRTDDALPPATPSPDVFLLNTTGELSRFYAGADLVFVGKSLTATGGQNPIEPAAWGRPILCGPNMQNFPVILADFLDAGALIQVADAPDLAREVRRLLEDHEARDALGTRSASLVRRRQGATERTLDALAAAGLSILNRAEANPGPAPGATAAAPAGYTGASPDT